MLAALSLAACGVTDSAGSSPGDSADDPEACLPGESWSEGACRPDGEPAPDLCPEASATPLHCLDYFNCTVSTPFECLSDVCPAATGAHEAALTFSECLGERCAAVDPADMQACASEGCPVDFLLCIADGDDDTCWSYDACVRRDCVPLKEADPPVEEGVFVECLNRCLDDEASERCRRCQSSAINDFLEERCPQQLRAYRTCGSESGCADAECVQARCPEVTQTLEGCLDTQTDAHEDALQTGLAPCYEPSDTP